MKRLTKSSIAEFIQPTTETVAFPLLGMEVCVGELSAEVVGKAAEIVAALGDTAEGNWATEVLFASYAITDGETRPFYDDDGRRELEKLPALAIRKIAVVAMKLSGMGETAKKN